MILLNQFHQILTSLIVTFVMEVVPKEVKKPEMMNIITLVQNVTLVKNMEDDL